MNLILAITLIILLLIVISKLGGISKALHAIKGEKNNEMLSESPETLVWSGNPGCFEKHLQRKHNNLLFPDEKRKISQRDIDLAVEQDLRDIQSIETDYKNILLESYKATLSESITIGEMSTIEDKLDALTIRCFEVGGASLQVLPGLRKINESVSADIQDGISEEDQEAARTLRQAREEYLKKRLSFSNEFFAQLNRKGTPIKREDVIASLLSEDLETIKLANDMGLSKDLNFLAEAVIIAHKAEAEGADTDILREKLKALGVKL
ncbi:MAG: hypothetical protein Q7S98_02500 [Deltaproteobacteria bacterium]|nr:hypothetical protein [Deltaproteobacteria bacterium]